jgi:hypothetical protein
MKLDVEKLECKKINKNIQQLFHDGKMLKFWSNEIMIPFGLENEYNKYFIKLELTDENHGYLKQVINHIEKMVMEKLNIEPMEFKSVVRKRENEHIKKKDMIECKLKTFKDKITTEIQYMDEDTHYLKTIYDLPKQSNVKVLFEVYGIWDYRTEGKKEKNKIGLILYANKIMVL